MLKGVISLKDPQRSLKILKVVVQRVKSMPLMICIEKVWRDLFHPEESVEHQTSGDPQEEISETN